MKKLIFGAMILVGSMTFAVQNVYDGVVVVPPKIIVPVTNQVVVSVSKTLNVATPTWNDFGFIDRLYVGNRTGIGEGTVTISTVDLSGGVVIDSFALNAGNSYRAYKWPSKVVFDGVNSNSVPYSAKDIKVTVEHNALTNMTPRVEYEFRFLMK